MSGITLTGSALLIGKPKNITCRINLISQTDIFSKGEITHDTSLDEESLHGIAIDPYHSFDLIKLIFPSCWTTSPDGINTWHCGD